jgi:hypothetical protein
MTEYVLSLGPGTITHGPTSDLDSLIEVEFEEDIHAEIQEILPFGEPVAIYRWDGLGWQDVAVPTDLDDGPGRNVVLGELQLDDVQNEIMTVSCKIEQFTVEAVVSNGQYEKLRGYVQITPKGLYVHHNITNPGRLVNSDGDVEILGQLVSYIARELDAAVFDCASRRLDQQTVKADEKARQKGGVNIGPMVKTQATIL